MRVTKDEVRGAYKYFGLFQNELGRVISDEFILRTEDPEEKALIYDYDAHEWAELDREIIFEYAGSEDWPGELLELSELHALWFLEQEHAFNGEGDDEAVEALLKKWAEKKEEYRENFGCGWPAKYVKTTFYLNGKKHSITPDSIGLERGESWDEGLLEYLRSYIGQDLKELGATEIRNFGFLD